MKAYLSTDKDGCLLLSYKPPHRDLVTDRWVNDKEEVIEYVTLEIDIDTSLLPFLNWENKPIQIQVPPPPKMTNILCNTKQ